jgi:hypothetical protein
MNNELLDWLLFFLKGVEQTAKMGEWFQIDNE